MGISSAGVMRYLRMIVPESRFPLFRIMRWVGD